MKQLLLTAIVSLITTQTYSATIRGARLDATQKNILIDVNYGGGCGQHQFSLDLKGCAESYPVQCTAELVHKTHDSCEALINTTVTISLSQYKLDTDYYSKGSLTITGDQDWKTKKPSSARVFLP